MQFQIAAVRRDLELMEGSAEAEEHKRNGVIIDRMKLIEADVAAITGGETTRNPQRGRDARLAAVRDVQSGTQQIVGRAAGELGGGRSRDAARQQSRGAEDLAAAIEEVASLAEDLQNAG